MDYVASRERLAGILNVKQVLLEAGRLSEMVYVTGGTKLGFFNSANHRCEISKGSWIGL